MHRLEHQEAPLDCLVGYKVKVVVGDKMKKDKRDFLNFFGAEIINFPGSTIEGNYYCEELIKGYDSNEASSSRGSENGST